jgi:thioredoxin 1
MTLETMEPNPVWVADAYGETVNVLEEYGPRLQFKIWGGDWCKDCRAQLPDFGAALEAASVPAANIEHHAVDREKQGPEVEAFDVERIPTVVVLHEGEEIARFVEEASVPIAVYLADRIEAALA